MPNACNRVWGNFTFSSLSSGVFGIFEGGKVGFWGTEVPQRGPDMKPRWESGGRRADALLLTLYTVLEPDCKVHCFLFGRGAYGPSGPVVNRQLLLSSSVLRHFLQS